TTVNFNKGDEEVELDKSTLTLVDKTGKEVKEVVVPGEGTYVLKDGVVEFTPEKDFVGKTSGVTVQVKDVNGKVVSETYTPTVRPDTRYVVIEKDGKETDLLPPKDGTKPSEQIPGYNVVRTEIDEKGNTKHIYEKVTTSFVDESGKPVSPSEEGNQPKKAISGYEFVKTTTDKDGNVTHVYRKVVKTTTSFVDESGKPVSPSEEGSQPKKDIPGYRFVETKKLPNGDTVHVYEKVTPPAPTPSPVPQPNPGKQNTTTWTDENGNPLKPTEPGSKEPGTIPGYEYVKTVTDSNGNIRHIFRKVEMPTPTPVEPTQPAQPVEPATPAIPEQPAKPQMPATPKYVDGKKELPNTGTEANASLAALGLLGALSGFGLLARKKKED
ncbi:LPXTG cell wall anchor domain-containing protein, partial [Streptococcus sp. 596553]|uniref:LPXTG cell wall anchor domain-containing protein n=1 Tax=Streptococcus sp. 596553 TaxID=2250596 RepID=UPI00135AE7C6